MQNRKRDTDVQNSLLDSVGEGQGGVFQENSIETCLLSRVQQISSPGWMHETSARTWCTGKTERDRVEREVGGGIGMGNTCKPMADSFQCMTKPTTIKKKIKKNLKNKVKVLVTQSCLTLCIPMDCNPLGSSVHAILQAKILEWVATPTPGLFPTQG